MQTYGLDLSLTPRQLEAFRATDSKIVIARFTESALPDVAWQAFRPLESNSVEWEDHYGIYASTRAVEDGNLLAAISRSEIPASVGRLYTFRASGAFDQSSAEGYPDSYCAANAYPARDFLTFGLYQDASINGTLVPGNPISAKAVLHKNSVRLTSSPALYVWVQSGVQGGSVVTWFSSPRSQVRFDEGVTRASLVYDSEHGAFAPARPAHSAKISE